MVYGLIYLEAKPICISAKYPEGYFERYRTRGTDTARVKAVKIARGTRRKTPEGNPTRAGSKIPRGHAKIPQGKAEWYFCTPEGYFGPSPSWIWYVKSTGQILVTRAIRLETDRGRRPKSVSKQMTRGQRPRIIWSEMKRGERKQTEEEENRPASVCFLPPQSLFFLLVSFLTK